MKKQNTYVGPCALLVYNPQTDQGEVCFGNRWSRHDLARRIDTLRDWIADLEVEYDRLIDRKTSQ